MSFLDVPGARLYYETHGSGPLLIMIPGAGGTADVFRMGTEHLAARYTVVIYDRRGFSRSELDGPQDYNHRLATDADDVRRLIEHVGDEPAIVFGASSGAIVALEVLTRHPSVVGTLVAFEPPVMRYLPDGQEWVDFFTGVYDLYQESGVEPAIARFRELTFPNSDMQVMARAPRNDANASYWFEHELRQYPAVELDLHSLATRADRIVFAAGREGRGYPAHDVTAELAKELGVTVIDLPGGHAGCVSHPDGFARGLVAALERASAPIPQTHRTPGVSAAAPTGTRANTETTSRVMTGATTRRIRWV
jgi:pimeloyl-ACP methyl ester carboxylesterase